MPHAYLHKHLLSRTNKLFEDFTILIQIKLHTLHRKIHQRNVSAGVSLGF